jgi:membrane protease subunit HflC
MQSYQATFLPDGQGKAGQTNMILSPNNEYLKEFTGR